jgi:leucyl aminopeptidase (aminopeptidase T)
VAKAECVADLVYDEPSDVVSRERLEARAGRWLVSDNRIATGASPTEMLGKVPAYQMQQVRDWRETRPATIRLTGNPFPTLMEGLDPGRLARSQPMELRALAFPILSGGSFAWSAVGAPTNGWADSIGVSDVLQLWDVVAWGWWPGLVG